MGLFDFVGNLFGGGNKGPNLQDAATNQGVSNSAASLSNYNLDNPNTYTPYGSSLYTPGLDTLDPLGNIVRGRPTLQQTLSPEEQAKLSGAQSAQIGGLGILNQSLPNISNALLQPFGYTGGPSIYTGANLNPLAGQTQTNLGNAGNIQGSLNFQGLPGLVGTDQATRNNVINAQYASGAQYLDPQFQRAQADQAASLANQGITAGSDAYKRQSDILGEQKQKAYSDLTQQSILAGNTALQQEQQAALANRGLLGQETQVAGQFANTAQGQNFNQLLSAMAAKNAGIAQQANILGTAGQIQNAGQLQGYNQYAQDRTMPLNMFNALLSGGQVNNPVFQPTQPVSQVPTPTLAGAQGQAQINAANSSAGAGLVGSGLGAIGSALSGGGLAAAIGLSDERLKEDMEKVGETPGGHNVYSYRIFGQPSIGVSAQEVEKTHPNLVFKNPFGIRAVNYAGIR